MLTRPYDRRKNHLEIAVTRPEILRNSDGSVQRHRNGNLKYYKSPTKFIHEDLFSVQIRKKFLDKFLNKESNITRCDLFIYIFLCSTCRYSQSCVLHDEAGEPIPAPNANGYVLAELDTQGNRTKSLTLAEICAAVKTSERCIRTSLQNLEALGLIRPIPVPRQSQTKAMKKAPGRPFKLVRFELNPEYMWNGPLEDGVGYLLSGRYDELGKPTPPDDDPQST